MCKFCYSKYFLCPLHINYCFLSESKLHILRNKLVYNSGAFAHTIILKKKNRSVVVKKSLLCKVQRERLTCEHCFQQFLRFEVEILRK